jgi:signal transduction histidine kinase
MVKNAVDFVPDQGGEIKVGVEQDDKDYLFYVKDNGVGISIVNQKNLFKKFFQVDTSATRTHGGTGLGLVVCKGIIEGLGGKIWIDSELGKGTIFYFTVPKSPIELSQV